MEDRDEKEKCRKKGEERNWENGMSRRPRSWWRGLNTVRTRISDCGREDGSGSMEEIVILVNQQGKVELEPRIVCANTFVVF